VIISAFRTEKIAMITRVSSVIRPKGSDLIFDHPYNAEYLRPPRTAGRLYDGTQIVQFCATRADLPSIDSLVSPDGRGCFDPPGAIPVIRHLRPGRITMQTSGQSQSETTSPHRGTRPRHPQ
jgi:hypothetical protein